MLLESFVQRDGAAFSFSRSQASRFAKDVASDFNPIHDEDSKRFCVPGDLLFSYLLHRYGLSAQLQVQFTGMVNADVWLHCVESEQQVQIQDQQGKVYLTMQRQGEASRHCAFIEALARDYVRFSGQNFPHILQPLMQQHQVMIHPQRPLVIYESMSLTVHDFNAGCPHLVLRDSQLTVDGKRGSVVLNFDLMHEKQLVGHGEKRMILSNLVPYDAEQMQSLVDVYNTRKQQLGGGSH